MDIVQRLAQLAVQQQNIIVMMKPPAKEQQEAGVFPNMAEAVGAQILPARLILVQAKKFGTAKMKQLVKEQGQAGAAVGASPVPARLAQNLKCGTATQKKPALEQEQTGAQDKI